MIKEYIAKFWCLHQWKELHKVNILDLEKKNNDIPIGYKIIYVCEKCGNFKEIEL